MADQLHAPVPYIVKLRLTASDDAAPLAKTWRGYAYSVLEACMQSSFEVGGTLGADTSKIVIESVGPDVETFEADLLKRLACVKR